MKRDPRALSTFRAYAHEAQRPMLSSRIPIGVIVSAALRVRAPSSSVRTLTALEARLALLDECAHTFGAVSCSLQDHSEIGLVAQGSIERHVDAADDGF